MCVSQNPILSICDQDNIGELDTDRQEELKRARRHDEEEEEKGRKSALLFGSEDTFDSIASMEEKVCLVSISISCDIIVVVHVVLLTVLKVTTICFTVRYFANAFFKVMLDVF